MKIILVLLVSVPFCTCVKLPSNFKKCNRKQTDFNKCLSEAVKDAFSQLTSAKKAIGVPKLDPLEIPSLTIGAGTSAVNFEQKYTDVKITGLSKVTEMDSSMDFDKKMLKTDFYLPELEFKFNYEFNGKILIMPITGKGTGSYTLVKPHFVMSGVFEEFDKGGQKHYKVVKTDIKIGTEKLLLKLYNLFNGDKLLGENINKVMNENWKEIFNDVKVGYEEVFSQIARTVMNDFYGKVPVSEIFD